MLKNLSIKQLLLLAFLLAGLLPAMLVSFLSFHQARIALKKEITRDMQTLSATVANDIERLLHERMRNVQSWSGLAIMQELRIGDVDKRLSTFLQGLVTSYGDTYLSIDVTNVQGVIVASSAPSRLKQILVTQKPWFTINSNGRVLNFYPLQQNQLQISQAVLDENTGQIIGYLNAQFNWKIVQNTLKQAIKQPTAAALFDEQNKILAATENWQSIEAKHEMHTSSQFSDISAMPNWQVRIEKLRSVAVAPVHRLGYVFLALLFSTLLLAALLVAPIARAITQPLQQLAQFVRGYGKNTSSSVPKAGPPEVRALGAAFELMTSDLEKSQAQLTRAAKLAVVGEMAAAMSHEVRTPLGILRSSADVLKREKKLSPEGQEVLGFISSETERLNKLVSTLIDAARPRQPNFTEINLTALVSNVIKLLQSQILAKKIALVFDASQTVEMRADADQMTQVMMNLIMNAIQLLPEQGKIEVTLQATERALQIAVADNGGGIAAEHQSQIFEPFFTQRAGGVGLGLAIVRQIVQAHGGEIYYETSHMGGAQFTMIFTKD